MPLKDQYLIFVIAILVCVHSQFPLCSLSEFADSHWEDWEDSGALLKTSQFESLVAYGHVIWAPSKAFMLVFHSLYNLTLTLPLCPVSGVKSLFKICHFILAQWQTGLPVAIVFLETNLCNRCISSTTSLYCFCPGLLDLILETTPLLLFFIYTWPKIAPVKNPNQIELKWFFFSQILFENPVCVFSCMAQMSHASIFF